MQEKKYGGYISKLYFNDGTELKLNKNDIVLFVGPNNVGKSQAIKDIFSICEKKKDTIVVNDIEIEKYDGNLSEILDNLAIPVNNGNFKIYSLLGKGFTIFQRSDESFKRDAYFSDFRDLFVANLDTTARLIISNPTNNISLNSPKTNPIHFAAFNREYREWLSDNFKKAFGTSLIPNTNFGVDIPLCIGEPVKLEGEYPDEQYRQEEYREILSKYKQVQDQGDGIKSFTSILLYLMLKNYCIYCIDEPESFLHPPQAKIIGQIIGKTLSENQQAFISTHSESFINGILESCADRVKIIRITRKDDANNFAILDNDTIIEIWKDSLLRHSNIMSSLFYRSVVLCESDSDCKFYSIIDEYLKEQSGKYSETLFIHCGGKHRVPKLLKALHSLNIDIKIIVDFDVLNNEKIIKEISSESNIDWNTISSNYNVLISNISSSKKINREDIKQQITAVIEKKKSTNLSTDEIKQLEKIISIPSSWSEIKKSGVSSLPSGDATNAFNNINEVFKQNGIFIVPVGELEGFVKEVGNHGPEWVNSVLEKYPDLSNSVYDKVKNFIKEIDI